MTEIVLETAESALLWSFAEIYVLGGDDANSTGQTLAGCQKVRHRRSRFHLEIREALLVKHVGTRF
jgi:hypothetical protein